MQTKTNQEQAINEYITKLKENEETISRISSELEKYQEKLHSAEQVRNYLEKSFFSSF